MDICWLFLRSGVREGTCDVPVRCGIQQKSIFSSIKYDKVLRWQEIWLYFFGLITQKTMTDFNWKKKIQRKQWCTELDVSLLQQRNCMKLNSIINDNFCSFGRVLHGWIFIHGNPWDINCDCLGTLWMIHT